MSIEQDAHQGFVRRIIAARLVVWLGIVLLALIGFRAARARAAELPAATTAAPSSGEHSMTRAFDQYVVKGGWITWVVLIPLSVTALALIVEYSVTIRRNGVIPPETVRTLNGLFDRGAYNEAVQHCGGDRSVLGFVLYSGLIEARNGYASMERAMEEAIEEQGARLSRKIEYLNLIGNVAPMVGLFGTVHGIIGMFVSIAEAGGIPIMSRISYSLGTALVATFWGLMVAIPSLTVFGLLRNRIDVLLAECALTADRLTSIFKPQPTEAARGGGHPAQAPVNAASS